MNVLDKKSQDPRPEGDIYWLTDQPRIPNKEKSKRTKEESSQRQSFAYHGKLLPSALGGHERAKATKTIHTNTQKRCFSCFFNAQLGIKPNWRL